MVSISIEADDDCRSLVVIGSIAFSLTSASPASFSDPDSDFIVSTVYQYYGKRTRIMDKILRLSVAAMLEPDLDLVSLARPVMVHHRRQVHE